MIDKVDSGHNLFYIQFYIYEFLAQWIYVKAD